MRQQAPLPLQLQALLARQADAQLLPQWPGLMFQQHVRRQLRSTLCAGPCGAARVGARLIYG